MSVNPVGLTPSNVTQLAQQIAGAIDANKDGQVTTDEFASFLSQVLNSTNPAVASALQSASGLASQDAATAGVTQISPSDWTGDSSPYGVTFAGFSQMNHTDLTLADLAKPQNAKYSAYNYLLSNRVAADGTWAPTAAQALNTQMGANVFKALDGETLAYGDEFIHSASNGYGLASGTYDPKAVGEFFWGASDDTLV